MASSLALSLLVGPSVQQLVCSYACSCYRNKHAVPFLTMCRSRSKTRQRTRYGQRHHGQGPLVTSGGSTVCRSQHGSLLQLRCRPVRLCSCSGWIKTTHRGSELQDASGVARFQMPAKQSWAGRGRAPWEEKGLERAAAPGIPACGWLMWPVRRLAATVHHLRTLQTAPLSTCAQPSSSPA